MKAHQPVEGARPGDDVQAVDAERERFLKMYGYVGEDGDGNPPEANREGPDYLMAENRDPDAEAERVEQVRQSDDRDDTPSRGREGAKSRAYTAMVEDRDRDAAFEAETEARDKATKAADKARDKAAKTAEREQRKAERNEDKVQRKADRDAAKAERLAKANSEDEPTQKMEQVEG